MVRSSWIYGFFAGSLILVHSEFGFAQAPKKGAPSADSKPSGSEPSSLEQSKKFKYKDKTELSFDDANIEGSIKNPFSSLLNTRDQSFNKGFVKLRTNWHDQMILSVGGLSQ